MRKWSERKTHVGVVEGVGKLNGIAGCGTKVDLVLGDELGAVEVVLLRNEVLGSNENLRVRVGDPDKHLSTSPQRTSQRGKMYKTVKFVKGDVLHVQATTLSD